MGVDYIKVGLYGIKTPEEAIFLLQNVNRAAKECNPKIKIVVAGYADAKKIGAIDPLLIPEIAHKAQVDVAMLDTSIKTAKTSLTTYPLKQLKKFVRFSTWFWLGSSIGGFTKKTGFTCGLRFRR